MRKRSPFRAIALVTSACLHARLHHFPKRSWFATAFQIATGSTRATPLARLPKVLLVDLEHRPLRPASPTSRPSLVFGQSILMSSTTNEGVGDDSVGDADSDPMNQYGLPGPLILGSGSFTRKLILGEMGVDYVLRVRSIDEQGIGDREGDPAELVLTLAKAKADHLVADILSGWSDDGGSENDRGEDNNDDDPSALPPRTEGYVVLTADQVVTHAGKILEKPEHIDEARSFVSRYATSPPRTVGSCVLTHIPSGIRVTGVDTATIRFRESVATCDLIDRLVAEGAPVLSCAGGLMVEHPLVREHLEGIDGTEDSVMGLSKRLVLELMAEMKEKLDR